MREIRICVGSSCFLRGSYRILDTFTALVREHGLEGQVDIAGAFCMEHCQNGVAVSIDGEVFGVPNAEAARAAFLQRLGSGE